MANELKSLTLNGTRYDSFVDETARQNGGGGGGSVGNAVLYTDQTLTEEQKAQARANIGAGSIEDALPKFVNDISECTDISANYVLPDGYIYRYMKALPKVTYETHDEQQWKNWGALESAEWILTKNTNIIPVKEGDQFIYTGNGEWSTSVFWLKSTSITDILATESYGNHTSPQTVTVTAPTNAKYVMFASWAYDDAETVLVVVPLTASDESSWTNTGIAYGTSKEYDERIASLEEEMNILKEDGAVGDVLKGKKIVYDGDSIAESRLGVANNGGGYAKIISDITKGFYENQAVGGGYLRSTTEEGRHSVVDNLDNLPKDGDLYCFEGGINDYWTNATLGTYSLNDFFGEVDKTTVCGALETIFRYALTNFVGKPICFIIVHKVQETAYTVNAEGKTFKDYRDSMVAICEKYSIPYYDAFSESGFNGWSPVQSELYMTANASGVGDGTHPNELGYKHYYVPQLLSLFRKILPVD
jgi:lysophospholipase L1-like esterase